jgi:hypothetical protein
MSGNLRKVKIPPLFEKIRFNVLVTLESVGAPRLTQDQRDVLLGFLDASAVDEPLLIKALQETRESCKWASRETTAE